MLNRARIMFRTLYGLTYTHENSFLSRPMRKPLLLLSPKVFNKTFYSHFCFICQMKQLEGTTLSYWNTPMQS